MGPPFQHIYNVLILTLLLIVHYARRESTTNGVQKLDENIIK